MENRVHHRILGLFFIELEPAVLGDGCHDRSGHGGFLAPGVSHLGAVVVGKSLSYRAQGRNKVFDALEIHGVLVLGSRVPGDQKGHRKAVLEHLEGKNVSVHEMAQFVTVAGLFHKSL